MTEQHLNRTACDVEAHTKGPIHTEEHTEEKHIQSPYISIRPACN